MLVSPRTSPPSLRFREALPTASLTHLIRLSSQLRTASNQVNGGAGLPRGASNNEWIRNPQPSTRQTSLAIAVESGRLDVVEWLVNDMKHEEPRNLFTASASKSRNRSRSDSSSSINANNDDGLQYEDSGRSSPNDYDITRMSDGSTVVHLAASKGFFEILECYLDEYPWVLDWTDSKGQTALHKACLKGETEACQLLINYGADINAPDLTGNTPLHCASSWGHLEVAKILIDQGAQIDAYNGQGFTALQYAFSFTFLQALKSYIKLHRERGGSQLAPQAINKFSDTNDDFANNQYLTPSRASGHGEDEDSISLLTHEIVPPRSPSLFSPKRVNTYFNAASYSPASSTKSIAQSPSLIPVVTSRTDIGNKQDGQEYAATPRTPNSFNFPGFLSRNSSVYRRDSSRRSSPNGANDSNGTIEQAGNENGQAQDSAGSAALNPAQSSPHLTALPYIYGATRVQKPDHQRDTRDSGNKSSNDNLAAESQASPSRDQTIYPQSSESSLLPLTSDPESKTTKLASVPSSATSNGNTNLLTGSNHNSTSTTSNVLVKKKRRPTVQTIVTDIFSNPAKHSVGSAMTAAANSHGAKDGTGSSYVANLDSRGATQPGKGAPEINTGTDGLALQYFNYSKPGIQHSSAKGGGASGAQLGRLRSVSNLSSASLASNAPHPPSPLRSPIGPENENEDTDDSAGEVNTTAGQLYALTTEDNRTHSSTDADMLPVQMVSTSKDQKQGSQQGGSTIANLQSRMERLESSHSSEQPSAIPSRSETASPVAHSQGISRGSVGVGLPVTLLPQANRSGIDPGAEGSTILSKGSRKLSKAHRVVEKAKAPQNREKEQQEEKDKEKIRENDSSSVKKKHFWSRH